MKNLIYINFIAKGIVNNSIFNINNQGNRDNCYEPYKLIKDKFSVHNIEINTHDLNVNKITKLDLHLDVQKEFNSPINYLLLLETPQIYPSNANVINCGEYKKIFTWNDNLVDGQRFIKINFPNPLEIHPVDGFESRNRFCCLIAGNKTLAVVDECDLYVERIKTIRWFEKNAPADFDLYGGGWDVPALGRGTIGKIIRRLFSLLSKIISMQPFPSYRGRVEHKKEVLTRTKFSICYENVRDLPGYITEKIFDSFFSGCVPVYWGANNITDYIPHDCFIDRRQFKDHETLYAFLKTMSEDEFKGYQQRIAAFLQSDRAYPFSAESFAKTVVETIVNDINS